MKNFNAITILLLIAIPFLSSCCKKCQDSSNPECENYDPCFRKITADFKMMISVEPDDNKIYLFECDTVHSISEVTFIAQDSSEVTYEWKIGTDPTVFNTRKVVLQFDNPAVLDVRLIVRKKNPCGAANTFADTITKRLVVSSSRFHDFFVGKYKGYLESKPSDLFTITILKATSGGYEGFSYINGLQRGCENRDVPARRGSLLTFGAYRDFLVGNSTDYKGDTFGPCKDLYGWGKLGKDDSSLEIKFKFYDITISKIVSDKFIGKKQ